MTDKPILTDADMNELNKLVAERMKDIVDEIFRSCPDCEKRGDFCSSHVIGYLNDYANVKAQLAAQKGYDKYQQDIKKNGGIVVFDAAALSGAVLREKEKELEAARKEGYNEGYAKGVENITYAEVEKVKQKQYEWYKKKLMK